MDRDLIWCAALLTAYRYLPKVASSIDRYIYSTAIGGLCSGQDAITLFDKIVSLNVRKEAIINIKVLTDKCLDSLEDKHTRLLKSRYFYRKGCDVLAKEQGVSERTLFRRLDGALAAMARAMRRLGYGSDWLDERVGKDAFMSEVYAKALGEYGPRTRGTA